MGVKTLLKDARRERWNTPHVAKTKEKYKARPRTEQEKEENQKLSQYFEAKLTTKIDEKKVNTTDPSMKNWAASLTRQTPDGQYVYKCFSEISPDSPCVTDAPLVIEDREGDDLPPTPNRQYKTPQALIPELQKFISEMLQKKWIEPSASEFSSPVLILKKPNGKGYRFVVDLRQVNKRSKPFAHYMPDIDECVDKLRSAKPVVKHNGSTTWILANAIA
ncbi:hypothetical protein N9L31_00325 [bacterium]|nr:hypothetical protein [bacterium]